jgi:hypothetical protein
MYVCIPYVSAHVCYVTVCVGPRHTTCLPVIPSLWFTGARADLNVARATENLDLALKQQRASKGELVGHLDFDDNGADGFADSAARVIMQRCVCVHICYACIYVYLCVHILEHKDVCVCVCVRSRETNLRKK